MNFPSIIITPNPLKQGLKRSIGELYQPTRLDYYPKSTKTRIETLACACNRCGISHYYPKSTKTRIETLLKEDFRNTIHIITPNPLKQGLKHKDGLIALSSNFNYYPKSTKTRIETLTEYATTKRTNNYYPKSTKTRIETIALEYIESVKNNYYPKSTKTRIETVGTNFDFERNHYIITPNPLKQGLKLSLPAICENTANDYYPKSTKTRIETERG